MHPHHDVGPDDPSSFPCSPAANDPPQVMGSGGVSLQLPQFTFSVDDDDALECAFEVFYDAREEIYSMSSFHNDNSEDGDFGSIVFISEMTGWADRGWPESVASVKDAGNDRPVVEAQFDKAIKKESFSPTAPSGQHASDRSDSPESVIFVDALEHNQPIVEAQFENIHTDLAVKPWIEALKSSQTAGEPSVHVDGTELGYTTASNHPFKDSGSASVEDDPSMLRESLSSRPIAATSQPVGAGTMGRHKKLAAVTRPQYPPLQSALKSPVLVKTPRIAKVSFSFDGVVEKSPRRDDNGSPSNNGHETNKSSASSSDQSLFTPRKSFQRHRRISSWAPSFRSPLGLGHSLTSINTDVSAAAGTIKSAQLPAISPAGHQKESNPNLRSDRFPNMTCSLPSTPKHGNHANEQFTTPDSRLLNPEPQAALFSQDGSRVYTTDHNDPFAEREYISSPTAEAVTSAYASKRPHEFQQYLGYQPLVDPFEDMDFPTVQIGSASASTRSQYSTHTPAQMNMQSTQGFSTNGTFAGLASPQVQGMGGLPYDLVGVGAQFTGDQQSIGSTQFPFGSNFANFPGSIPDTSPFATNFPIPPSPLCHLPQTSPNRARLNSRKSKRTSWIKTEANNIFRASENIGDMRIQFLNSGSQEDFDNWKAAEEEFRKLTSMDYQIQNRRKMFMNEGVEPLRMGAANVSGDGFHGDGQEGGLVGFEMALMERIGVEATRRENRGEEFVAAASAGGDIGGDGGVDVGVCANGHGLPKEKNRKEENLARFDAINTPKYPPTPKKQPREKEGVRGGKEAPADAFA